MFVCPDRGVFAHLVGKSEDEAGQASEVGCVVVEQEGEGEQARVRGEGDGKVLAEHLALAQE